MPRFSARTQWYHSRSASAARTVPAEGETRRLEARDAGSTRRLSQSVTAARPEKGAGSAWTSSMRTGVAA